MSDPTLLRLVLLAPIAALIYYLLPRRRQNIWLLIVSYAFYGSWNWMFPLILVVVTLGNYLIAQRIERSELHRRAWLISGIVFNVLGIVVTKYGSDLAGSLMRLSDVGDASSLVAILLPIGLSFRVLETISYLVDVSNSKLTASTNLLDFSLYLAYFPKIIAGPIERARTFLPKLASTRRVDNETLARAVTLFVIGAVRKAVIADPLRAMIQADIFTTSRTYANPLLITSLIAYAFALYNDFAGYTSMMRGISLLFGIELSPNFETPYFSRNITEFWNRWHMTFSFWLRDYIFFPVSRALAKRISNRNHIIHVIVPPGITMFISAIWHEARPGMLLWGMMHAAMMIGWRLPTIGRSVRPLDKQAMWRHIAGGILLFTLVSLAWIPFTTGVHPTITYMERLTIWDFSQPFDWRFLLLVIPGLILDWGESRRGELRFIEWPLLARSAGLAMAILLIVLMSLSAVSAPFVYGGF